MNLFNQITYRTAHNQTKWKRSILAGAYCGKQCPWIAIRLPALLVEGVPQAPMNAEFHSAAARPLDAFDHDQLAAAL